MLRHSSQIKLSGFEVLEPMIAFSYLSWYQFTYYYLKINHSVTIIEHAQKNKKINQSINIQIQAC